MSAPKPTLLSVIVPAFNEEANLEPLIDAIRTESLQWRAQNLDFELIFVDDGSSDGTEERIGLLQKADPRIKLVGLSRNFGHQAAITAGLQYAQGECVAILDADLQDPPKILTQMLSQWMRGYDVVYGVRRRRKGSRLLGLLYKLFYRMQAQLASIQMPLDSGDFCLLDRQVVEILNRLPERSRYVRGLRSWIGYRQIGVEYDRPDRHKSRSKYSVAALFNLAIQGITSFSHKPIRAISGVGIVTCLVAFVLGVGVLIWYGTNLRIFGMNPRDGIGWTSLVLLILGFSGIQILFIGIIGEYLAQIFIETKARPVFLVKKEVGFDSAPKATRRSPLSHRDTPSIEESHP